MGTCKHAPDFETVEMSGQRLDGNVATIHIKCRKCGETGWFKIGDADVRWPDSEESKDPLDTYWEALYAVRCIAEHTGGKRATAKKMRADVENIRQIADDALVAVQKENEGIV
jgi:hypothetical protein